MLNDGKCAYRKATVRELFCEVACDYVLPDYLGEVRKILHTEACALALPAYMNGEEVCASGGVRFRMVYADAEGQLSSVEFSEDYETGERIALSGQSDISSDTAVESCSMRLLGPRKISAKARVGIVITALTEESAELSGTAFDAGVPELAEKTVLALDKVISEPIEREYAEELVTLEGAIADEVKVIYENAVPVISECRVSDGEVWVSGEYRVCALVTTFGNPACLYKKTIPFAETLDLEGVSEQMTPDVKVVIPSLKINVTPTETGSSVVASLIAEYTPEAKGNRELSLVTDGYMTDRDVSCEYGDIEIQSFCGKHRVEDTLRCELSAEALSLESPTEILYLSAEPKIKSLEITADTAKITAEIKFSGIACEINGEKTAYAPIRHTAEWHFEVAVDEVGGRLVPSLSVCSTAAEGSINDNGIILTAELRSDLELIGKESHRRLCRIDAVGDAEKRDRQGRILVYYPDSEDTLFSVARRFHTTTRKIAIDNSLTEATVADKNTPDSLRGIDKLIIK